MRTKTLLTFLMMVFSLSGMKGQTTEGTRFWLGFMDNILLAVNDDPIFTIVIHSDVATGGTIEVPATGLEIAFVANAGTTQIDLPDAVWYTVQNSILRSAPLLFITGLTFRRVHTCCQRTGWAPNTW